MQRHAVNPVTDTCYCGTKTSRCSCWAQDMRRGGGKLLQHLIFVQHDWTAPSSSWRWPCMSHFAALRSAASFNFLRLAHRVFGRFHHLRAGASWHRKPAHLQKPFSVAQPPAGICVVLFFYNDLDSRAG